MIDSSSNDVPSFTVSELSQEMTQFNSNALVALRNWCKQSQLNGKTLFDLSMINPDLAPSREILDRFIEASLKPTTHRYSSARGLRKLREAFADKYRDTFQVQLDPESEVCVALGTKDATLQVLSLYGGAFSTLLLPLPTYPAMHSAASLIGDFQIEFYEADSSQSIISSLERAVEKNPKSLILLNCPGNPTGICPSIDDLKKIIHIARESGCHIFNDFVYGEMGFVKKPSSILRACDGDYRGVLEVYSMSKAYSIPGWRVAGLVGCRELVEQVATRKSHTDYGTFTPIQVGAAAGLRASGSFLADTVSQYSKRAHLVTTRLNDFMCYVEKPEAGASVWARLPESYDGDAESFVRTLVLEEGVVTLPGIVFGNPYRRYFRISLVQPELVLSECLDRIKNVLGQERSQ
jgi:alanine-synthesizing transaminase